jgi:hypothetical protein
MLYVAVEGKPPFGLDDNTLALLRSVAEGQVEPPRRAGPLAPLLMQLMADDPATRPSMPEAAAALGAVAARGGAAAPTPPLFTSPTIAAPDPRMAAAAPTQETKRAFDLPADRPLPRRAHRVVWWRRPAAFFSAAACLVIVAVVLAMLGNTPTTGRGQLAAAKSPAPATRAPQLAQLPPAPQAPPAAVQPAPAEPTQLEQTVRTYYGLLPEDTAEAWQYLGETEQAQGFQHYTKFWNGINRISIRGPVAVQGTTVLVNLVFEPTNRKPTVERYRLNMTTSPVGRIVIGSASRIAN